MKLMVSGCSYTEGYDWPESLLDCKIDRVYNYGRRGAGNSYIANSISYHALKEQPDFVFVLWSGINRTELRVPNSEAFDTFVDQNSKTAVVGESLYFIGQGSVNVNASWIAGYEAIRDPAWPEVKSIRDWFALPQEIQRECLEHKIYLSSHAGRGEVAPFAHQYFLTQNLTEDRKYASELSFQHMMNCHNVLERQGIPYRFSFIYDPWYDWDHISFGQAVTNCYSQAIDWNKFVDLPPLNYGLQHDLMSSDGWHLSPEGMRDWAGQVRAQLATEPELKNFFNLTNNT
jgi:hypothetical protein